MEASSTIITPQPLFLPGSPDSPKHDNPPSVNSKKRSLPQIVVQSPKRRKTGDENWPPLEGSSTGTLRNTPVTTAPLSASATAERRLNTCTLNTQSEGRGTSDPRSLMLPLVFPLGPVVWSLNPLSPLAPQWRGFCGNSCYLRTPEWAASLNRLTPTFPATPTVCPTSPLASQLPSSSGDARPFNKPQSASHGSVNLLMPPPNFPSRPSPLAPQFSGSSGIAQPASPGFDKPLMLPPTFPESVWRVSTSPLVPQLSGSLGDAYSLRKSESTSRSSMRLAIADSLISGKLSAPSSTPVASDLPSRPRVLGTLPASATSTQSVGSGESVTARESFRLNTSVPSSKSGTPGPSTKATVSLSIAPRPSILLSDPAASKTPHWASKPHKPSPS
ncbi:hypothetical protein C0991_002684, partial [Blastosporella zonata]